MPTPTKPVVFVPGLPGSQMLHDQGDGTHKRIFPPLTLGLRDERVRLLQGPTTEDGPSDVVAGEPIRKVSLFGLLDLTKQADVLYDLLRRGFGYRIDDGFLFPFGWDWRRSVNNKAMLDALQQTIEQAHQTTGRKAVVIVHSTGGLVLRALLERTPAVVASIEHVLAFGVPWAGTLKSFKSLAGHQGLAGISARKVQAVMAHSWAAFDLLPPDPPALGGPSAGLVFDTNGNEASVLDLRWLAPGDPLHPAMTTRASRSRHAFGNRLPTMQLNGARLPITNIVGWGKTTTRRLTVDGTPGGLVFDDRVDNQNFDDGDGTAARRSAEWLAGPDVRTFYMPLGYDRLRSTATKHSNLWRSDGGREWVKAIVGGTQRPHHVHAAVDHNEGIGVTDQSTVSVRVVAQDTQGAPLPNARVKFPRTGRQEAFDPTKTGLHLIQARRSDAAHAGGNVYRLATEISWDDPDGGRATVERPLKMYR